MSLQVLCDPGRHGVLLPWVVRFKEKISAEAFDHIMQYSESLGTWAAAISPVLERGAISDLSVPAVLHDLDGWQPGDFASAFGGRGGRSEWARFVKFLWDYWSDYFHEEFYWIEPLLVGSIRQQAPEARRNGTALLQSLTPHVAGQLAEGSWRETDVRLVPSVFCVHDRPLGQCGSTVTACYPVAPGIYRRPENLTPPDPLARLLKTLADETRLKLLKLMLEEHKCTKDLAEALNLAEPTVSRHLRRLRDADLVEAHEQGNFIYYTAKLERIAELHMKVLDFLRS